MDVLRKELNAFYEGQHLADEQLDYSILTHCRHMVATAVEVEGDCRVITDAAADLCYIFGGQLAWLLGLSDGASYSKAMDSSDEDVIYHRIHPEDLVDKRMLEYDFFRHVDALPPERRLDCRATCRFRIRDRAGRYVYVDNSTRIMRLSAKGKVWLVLCCYALSPLQHATAGIDARIMDCRTGEIVEMSLSDRRGLLLTDREKEILSLIRDGKLSKQIAAILGISIHTVNRHRQNIIGKLSVANSVEAVAAATLMRLL